MTLKLDKQLELHRMMMLIRLFEEALEEMFSRGLLHGTMHLSIGQEASAAGACLALDKEDLITSTHRGHGHCLGKGADPFKMFAELLGEKMAIAEVAEDQCILLIYQTATLEQMESLLAA